MDPMERKSTLSDLELWKSRAITAETKLVNIINAVEAYNKWGGPNLMNEIMNIIAGRPPFLTKKKELNL